MPKLTDTAQKQIAPFLLSMLERGLSLREIEKTLCSIKPLTYEAIRKILDNAYHGRYTQIIDERKKKKVAP